MVFYKHNSKLNSILYMNAVFWLVDKRGIFDQFLVCFRFIPIAGVLVLENSE
jgi:hypothetical protein